MPVKIFFSYAHKDEDLLNRLKTHLSPLQRQGLIDVWYDRDISAGTDWAKQIDTHLESAQIILLLVSPDFMASDYINSVEVKRAVERHKRGESRVIPIILRHIYYWQGAPFGELQALPTDAKPVVSAHWYNPDEAFFNVTEGIYKVVRELSAESAITASTQEQDQTIALITKARQEMDHLIRLYKDIRYFIPPSRDKTRNMENVRQSMQEQAKRTRYTPEEITSFLLSLDEGERLAGLATLQWRKDVDPQNVDHFEQVINFMEKPRSPYEHYHTLEVLKGMKPHLSDQQRDKLRDAVRNHIYDRNADSEQWPAFCRDILGEDSNECR